jgi:hypothetical protein
MVDLGTGNNNKINWAMNNKQVSRHVYELAMEAMQT